MKYFKVKTSSAPAIRNSLRPAEIKLRRELASVKKTAQRVHKCDDSSPDAYAERISEETMKDFSSKLVFGTSSFSYNAVKKLSGSAVSEKHGNGRGKASDTFGCEKTASGKIYADVKHVLPSSLKISDESLTSGDGSGRCRFKGRSGQARSVSGKFKTPSYSDAAACVSSDIYEMRYSSRLHHASSDMHSPTHDRKMNAAKKSFQMQKAAVSLKKSAGREVLASVSSKPAVKALIVSASGFLLLLLLFIFISSAFSSFASPYAVLYASDGEEISSQIKKINDSFNSKINELVAMYDADEYSISGARASWRDMLCVYAAGYLFSESNTSDNPVSGYEYLEKVFYDMNSITVSTETQSERYSRAVRDSDGNISYVDDTSEKSLLRIRLNHLCCEDMALLYSFTSRQLEIMHLLEDESYADIWTEIIFNAGAEDDIVSVALSQLGNRGGEPYWSWYGYTERVEWCACFVSWCAYVCGYIEDGSCIKFDNCRTGADFFISSYAFCGRDCPPERGNIIFFDWQQDGVPDHVGIVESVSDEIIYTVEGNSGDSCTTGSYPLYSEKIYGFGILSSK